MARKRYTAEQIITKLREAEVELAKGQTTPQVCKKLTISDRRDRWRKELRNTVACGLTRPSDSSSSSTRTPV